MINEIQKFTTLYQVQKYICNALLKFEGLGMSQLNKPEQNLKLKLRL